MKVANIICGLQTYSCMHLAHGVTSNPSVLPNLETCEHWAQANLASSLFSNLVGWLLMHSCSAISLESQSSAGLTIF